MKVPRLLFFFLLMAMPLRADPGKELAKIREERKEILEKAVRLAKQRHAEGVCGSEEVIESKVRLNRFHRDTASDLQKKKEFQAEVVALRKSQFLMSKANLNQGSGGASIVEVMNAEERFLAAKEKYLLMQLEEHNAAGKDQETR